MMRYTSSEHSLQVSYSICVPCNVRFHEALRITCYNLGTVVLPNWDFLRTDAGNGCLYVFLNHFLILDKNKCLIKI
jgi:hypothetical protein